MIELFYYIDSAGLNEGNRELADMGCEEWSEKEMLGWRKSQSLAVAKQGTS